MKRYIISCNGGITMKRLVLVVAAFFLVALASSAAPLTVSWADGSVDVQKGSAWTTVSMGDKVDSSSTLRLGVGASVELTDGKRKMALTAAGTYVLDSLLKQGGDAAKKKASALDKLGKLVDPKASTSTTSVAAVRGAAVEPAKDSVTWMSDSVDVSAIMEEGRKLVRDGDFASAAAKFDEAVFAAEGDEKDSASYAQAWSLAADDSSAKAVKILRGMPDSGQWAGPRALLLARLDIDSGAKAEAKTVLEAAEAASLLVGDDVDLANALLAEANAK
jgi:hypothetical protein